MKYLEYLLVGREYFVKYFKQFEIFLLPVFKFIFGYVVFSGILSIGLMNETVAGFAGGFPPAMLAGFFALLFTVLPMNMSWLLIIAALVAQFTSDVEVAAALFIFLMFIYLFYARMAPKESVFILVTVLAFRFNVPYLVPMLAGLYFPLSTIFPISIGVFVHSQTPLLFGLASPAEAVAEAIEIERDFVDVITELPDTFAEIYAALMASLQDAGTWLFTAVIFAMVVVLVHFVSRQSFDYAKQIAIGLGFVMTVFGFVVSVVLGTDEASIGMVILGAIACAVIAAIVTFFDMVLDYNRVESVQFEDEHNFYHVRIVPKMTMTTAVHLQQDDEE